MAFQAWFLGLSAVAISFALWGFMKFEADGEVRFPEIKVDIWKQVSAEDREQFEIRKYVKKNG